MNAIVGIWASQTKFPAETSNKLIQVLDHVCMMQRVRQQKHRFSFNLPKTVYFMALDDWETLVSAQLEFDAY